MRNRTILSFCIIALAGLLAVNAEGDGSAHSIAILDLEASGLDAGEVKTLSDALRNNIIDQGAYTVLERSKMDVILKEQGFQASGACTNEACAVEMGQLLGVDAMVLGSVGRVGKTYSVTVRMLDIKTGKIFHSASEYYKGEIDGLLTETMRNIAVKLATTQKAAPAPQPAAAPKDAVQTQAAPEPAAPAKQETVGKGKSHTILYITIGAVALAGGVGAFLFLNKSSEEEQKPGGDTPQTPPSRPGFPTPPSYNLAVKGGN